MHAFTTLAPLAFWLAAIAPTSADNAPNLKKTHDRQFPSPGTYTESEKAPGNGYTRNCGWKKPDNATE